MRPPRQLRPTRAGWIFFALTFGVGFAALNTGNNLLYLVLALMLAFLVLSGVMSESALRGVAVGRRLPREFYAGRDAWVGLEIHNQKARVAAYALVVEDRVLGAEGERPAGRGFALRIEPGERVTRSYRLCPERRGELEFAGFVVSTRFPFGLFSKSLSIPARERTLVYPAVDRIDLAPSLGAVREGGDAPDLSRGRGTDVGGIREYAHGDPTRRIDWRATLRTGALWVRELEGQDPGEVEVRLSTGGRPGEDFERAVRHSASQVVSFLERGLRVGLRTEADRLEPGSGLGQRARLLTFLARVEPGREPA